MKTLMLIGLLCFGLNVSTVVMDDGIRAVQEENKKQAMEYQEERLLEKREIQKEKEAAALAALKPTDFYRTDLPEDIEQYTIDVSNAYGVPPEIVFSVMWQESRYTIDIMGDGGKAYGLMQIRPEWHQDRMARLNCNNLLDPYQNILVGVDLISELYRTYGDINLALTYYRHGTINGDGGYAALVNNVSNYVLGYTNEIVYPEGLY